MANAQPSLCTCLTSLLLIVVLSTTQRASIDVENKAQNLAALTKPYRISSPQVPLVVTTQQTFLFSSLLLQTAEKTEASVLCAQHKFFTSRHAQPLGHHRRVQPHWKHHRPLSLHIKSHTIIHVCPLTHSVPIYLTYAPFLYTQNSSCKIYTHTLRHQL